MAGILLDSAITFGASYFVAAASPGPNFVIVSRAGLAASRSEAIKTTAGVVLGAMMLTLVAATCSHWLPKDGLFLAATEVVFAALLLRWSYRSITSALRPAGPAAQTAADERHLRTGFVTAVSNPFTAMFLTTAVDQSMSTLEAVGIVFVIATAWFGLIGVLCRLPVMHELYARYRRQVEGLFGVVFLIMACRTLLRLTSA